MKLTTVEKKLSAREQREQEIAFNKEDDLITRMIKVLEYRGYIDTNWRSENTFEEDVRPLFEKMIKQSLQDTTEEREMECVVGDNCPNCNTYGDFFPTQKYCSYCGAKIKRID